MASKDVEKTPRETADPTYTEDQKTAYFQELATGTLSAFRLHKEHELFDRDEKGEKGWRNVSEHCLAELARADVLADWLRFPEDVERDLKLAAAVHDFRKKKEILERRADPSWDAATVSVNKTAETLLMSPLNRNVIQIAEAPGSRGVLLAEKMLSEGNLTEPEIAYLVMHYLDDITSDSDWVNPAGTDEQGNAINDLDRRLLKLLANPKYAQEIEEGRKHLGGRNIVEAMLECGNKVEELLERLVRERSGIEVEHKRLPEMIDQEIKERIASM